MQVVNTGNTQKSVYVTARVSAEMKAELVRRATQQRRTVSQIILMLLESALANGKKK